MTGPKRRRAFGAVEVLASGRFRASYVPSPGARRVVAPSTFATRKAAGQWLDSVAVDLRRGVHVDPQQGAQTLSVWGRRFLDAHRWTIKESTADGYLRLWMKAVEPALGHLALRSIKPSTVRGWIGSMSAAGLSPNSVIQRFRVLSLVLNAALDDGEIATNPCVAVRRALPRPPEPDPRIITEEDVERLRVEMPDRLKVLVDVLAYGGLRIGEALALRRKDVDPLRSRLHVRLAVGEVNGRLVVGPTKTHQQRALTLPTSILAALVEHLRGLPADPDTWLFPSRTGQPLRYGSLRRHAWDAAATRAGLPGLTPHSLRASCASWVAAEHGVMEAARRLGHSNSSITTTHYARAISGGDERVADALEARRQAGRAARPATTG